MSKFIHQLARPSHRLAARLKNSRPGSVLILVVALLVLMALIGTAWLTTARVDRYGAQQNTYNTQVDLLVQAAISLAHSVIIDDLFGEGYYRPHRGTGEADYEHRDFPQADPDGLNHDGWLATRLPRDLDLATAGDQVGWPAISGPPLEGVDFEAPYAVDSGGNPFAVTPVGFTNRIDMYPDFIDVPSAAGTQRHAAFNIGGNKYVAADVDSDGIADSALFRLPVGSTGGVTFYAAIRIIDNNSAVNVNTAYEANAATAAGSQFFPSNINLMMLLNPVDPDTGTAPPARTQLEQMIGLDRIRFTSSRADDVPPPPNPVPRSGTGTDPLNSTGNPRTDFDFVSGYETMWRQMGARLFNPGYFDLAGNNRFNPLPISEQTMMAFRFIMKNPVASRTILEDSVNRFGPSVYDSFTHPDGEQTPPDKPYTPDQIAEWFRNFTYDTTGTAVQMPLRSLLVTNNGVSNFAPTRYGDVDDDDDGAGEAFSAGEDYKFGEYVTVGGRAYMCMLENAGPSFAPPTVPFQTLWTPGTTGAAELIWAPMSWSTHPTKASLNTAGFGELFMAYAAVMDNRAAGAADPVAPYPVPALTAADARLTHPRERRQFRNPLRNPNRTTDLDTPPLLGDFQLLPNEVMKLRAAIAAVNTIDLRDSDRDITARRLFLKAAFGANRTNPEPSTRFVDVNVYGYEPQPFITEVYANSQVEPDPSVDPSKDNPKGYVAIELYNPYPFDISLKNWNLGVVDRRSYPAATADTPSYSQYPFLVMQAILEFTGFGNPDEPPTHPTVLHRGAHPVPVVPAEGFLILENYITPTELADATFWPGATTGKTNAAKYRPQSSELPTPAVAAPSRYWVPNLHEVMRDPISTALRGGEVYLLRPRRGDGTLTYDRRTQANHNEEASFPYNEVNSDDPFTDARQRALAELVPVDSIDLTGLEQADATIVDPVLHAWHYTRLASTADGEKWRCMYPGRWDPTHPWDAAGTFRQEGMRMSTWTQSAGEDPWIVTPPPPTVTMGTASPTPSFATHPFGPIQLSNEDAPGWNRLMSANGLTVNAQPYSFPFGGFARNADVLQVPFMGAYRIRHVAFYGLPPQPTTGGGFNGLNPFLELNPITQDLLFAHDADTRFPAATDLDNPLAADDRWSDDADEQVGRFCLIEQSPRDLATMPPGAIKVNDFVEDSDDETRYAWAKDLLDYVTVQSPQDDYLPDVDPSELDTGVYPHDPSAAAGDPARPPDPVSITKYPAATPEAVPNKAGTAPADANLGREDDVGLQGLVNINTAPWEVLQTVPMLPDAVQNRALAQAIVYYRDVDDGTGTGPHGPFKSLFELNDVYDPTSAATPDIYARPGFRNGWGTLAVLTDDFDDVAGDLSPEGATDLDGVTADFESRFLMLNRVSNLITTRSDTFTVYVQVQGWRDVESGNPELVVQRRAAFVADRISVNKNRRTLNTVNVPTN